jgi:hypothetical protein
MRERLHPTEPKGVPLQKTARVKKASWPGRSGSTAEACVGSTATITSKASRMAESARETEARIVMTLRQVEISRVLRTLAINLADARRGLARCFRLYRRLLQSNTAPFIDRKCRPDRDGAKSSSNPSTFSGEVQTAHRRRGGLGSLIRPTGCFEAAVSTMIRTMLRRWGLTRGILHSPPSTSPLVAQGDSFPDNLHTGRAGPVVSNTPASHGRANSPADTNQTAPRGVIADQPLRKWRIQKE